MYVLITTSFIYIYFCSCWFEQHKTQSCLFLTALVHVNIAIKIIKSQQHRFTCIISDCRLVGHVCLILVKEPAFYLHTILVVQGFLLAFFGFSMKDKYNVWKNCDLNKNFRYTKLSPFGNAKVFFFNTSYIPSNALWINISIKIKHIMTGPNLN